MTGRSLAKTLRRARYREERSKSGAKFERMKKPTDYKSFIKYLWALADCQTRGVDPGTGNDIGCGEELGVMRTIQNVMEYRHLFKGEKAKKKKQAKLKEKKQD